MSQTMDPGTGEPQRTSLSDWAAGYETGHRAGYLAGYRAGLAVLDEAAAALAELRPSRAVDVVQARAQAAAPGRRPGEVDHTDPIALAAYRARIYASWGLDPPAPDPPGDAEPAHPAAAARTGITGAQGRICSRTTLLTRTRQRDGRRTS